MSVGGGGEPSLAEQEDVQGTGKGCWAPKGVLDTIPG